MLKFIERPRRIRVVPPQGRLSPQRGFSLLEILVAFSILAISLGILLNIFSEGANTAVIAEEYTVASQIADSLLARAGVDSPLMAAQYTGVENAKYQWTVTVEPYNLTIDDIDTTAIPATLYMVTVSVYWAVAGDRTSSGERRLVLTTLKLAGKSI
ncbi:MAG: type IV pilus modification PilV family protein [Gammaproteobacteria bacterium]